MDQNLKNSISNELEWTYSKSSGPGGQHVNTTDSKARLLWAFRSSGAIKDKQKFLIEKKLQNYIKKNQCIHLTCSTNRNREMNKKSCLAKLFYLLEHIAFKEEKLRRKTRPTRASKEKRLQNKKSRSDTKKNRGKVSY